MVKLLKEAVERHDIHAGTFGDTGFATTVQQGRVRTLFGCHRVDHRFDRFERIVADLHTLHGFVHTRDHTHQVFHRTHLLDLRQLAEEIIEVELVLGDLLTDPACLRFVVLLLRTLHERHHVTHTQDTIGHTRGVEHIECFHLLARTDELDRFLHHRTDREGSTASCITVQLGQYHTVKIDAVIELLGGVDGVLTGHGIDHEQGLARRDRLFDRCYLLHHLLIDRQTTGSIDDHYVVPHATCLADGVLRNLHRITTIKRLGRITIKQSTISEYFRSDLLTEHTQLLDSGRTIDVAGYQHHPFVLLRLQIVSQLGSESGFTATLQTGHQDDRRRTLEVQVLRLTAHQFRQLIVGDLHQELSRTNGIDHVLSQGFLLHAVGELLGGLVVDVGLQERFTDILNGLRNIDFGDTTLTLQNLKTSF